MTWQWSASAARYRDSVTGRFLSKAEALGFVDESLAATGNVTDVLGTFVGGDAPAISPDDWRSAMRREIKDEYIRQYLLGKGGIEQMTSADWGSIGGDLAFQYAKLDGFAEEIKAGLLSEAQITARSRMYINSARKAYEKANIRALGLPELPQYPADGQQICLSNCKCFWRIEEMEGGWDCYWELMPAEHCDTCLENNDKWYPLEIRVA